MRRPGCSGATACNWTRATQVLPVNGSREALVRVCPDGDTAQRRRSAVRTLVVCPNPFYQIYEGAAYPCRCAQPYFVPSPTRRAILRSGLGQRAGCAVWARTQLLYVCTPGNPAGAVMPLSEWAEAV
jgi:N-succinyldiaminopimelate aminotransferase